MGEQWPPEVAYQPVVNLIGERLTLGPLDRDLLATYQRWNNDFPMARTIGQPVPYTLEQVADDFRQLAADDRMIGFTIYERVIGRPIGNTAWTDVDWRNRTAEYVLFIGEADCRGKGYGTDWPMVRDIGKSLFQR